MIETAKVELFGQQKTSFPFDSELLGNLDFKKDRRLSKEELIKYIPEKNNSINVDSKSLKQENKNQPDLEKKLATIPKINLPTTTPSENIIATSSTTAPVPILIPTISPEINQDKTKSISTLIDSISSEKKQTKVKEENKIEVEKSPEDNISNDKNLIYYDDQPVLWKDLSPEFKESMPKMKLNGITFFEKEKDRYVIINMYKYQIDDVVEKGPSIDEIRKDSIIMFYEDTQFILPLGL